MSEFKAYIVAGMLSAFGALVHSFYLISKGRKVTWLHMVITLVIGFYVGQVVGSFLPANFEYRDGILLISGFGCYSVLDMLKDKIDDILNKAESIIDILTNGKKKK